MGEGEEVVVGRNHSEGEGVRVLDLSEEWEVESKIQEWAVR